MLPPCSIIVGGGSSRAQSHHWGAHRNDNGSCQWPQPSAAIEVPICQSERARPCLSGVAHRAALRAMTFVCTFIRHSRLRWPREAARGVGHAFDVGALASARQHTAPLPHSEPDTRGHIPRTPPSLCMSTHNLIVQYRRACILIHKRPVVHTWNFVIHAWMSVDTKMTGSTQLVVCNINANVGVYNHGRH